tara:strand:+ start:2475 stop:2696 length:222 start_codon:yes stop_codon:yes gene_type:complete
MIKVNVINCLNMNNLSKKRVENMCVNLCLDVKHAKVANGSKHETLLMLKGGGCKVLYSDGTIENSSIEWLKCG